MIARDTSLLLTDSGDAILSPGIVEGLYDTYLDGSRHPGPVDWMRSDLLPFVAHDIYRRWLPPSVKILFIAESPPWIGVQTAADLQRTEYVYFYNAAYDPQRGPRGRTTLGSTIFRHLGVEGATRREQLARFREAGLFLTDTIKCVFYKNRKPAIPPSLIRFSAQSILEPEIARIDPNYICTLGNTAFAALCCMDRFRPVLEEVNGVAKRGEPLIEGMRPGLIRMPFPNQRNRGRQSSRERMDAGFETVRALLGWDG